MIACPRTLRHLSSVIRPALALLLATSAPALAAPEMFTTHTGVRVVVSPEPQSDFVAICAFVRAGAQQEEGRSGVGNVTARSLFGANAQNSAEIVARTLFVTGGSLEQRWTPDYTAFTVLTTRGEFRDSVQMIADALKSPELAGETLARGRRAAAEDAREAAADPFRAGWAAVRAALYPGDPTAATIGGDPADIERTRPEAVRRYFERWYTPGNTVVAVAGNVTADEVRRVAENHFVDFDRKPGRPALEPDAPGPVEPVRAVVVAPAATTVVIRGYRAPALGDANYPAFTVLKALLGGGKSSRLFRRIRDESGIGYAVGAYAPPQARAGYLAAYVEYDAGRSTAGKPTDGVAFAAPTERAVEKLLADTVRSVIEEPPGEAEVDRARRYATGSYALAHQRARDRAFYLGWYETVGVGYAFDAELPKRLAAVTREDVLRAARKYLDRGVTVVVAPKAGEQASATALRTDGAHGLKEDGR